MYPKLDILNLLAKAKCMDRMYEAHSIVVKAGLECQVVVPEVDVTRFLLKEVAILHLSLVPTGFRGLGFRELHRCLLFGVQRSGSRLQCSAM